MMLASLLHVSSEVEAAIAGVGVIAAAAAAGALNPYFKERRSPRVGKPKRRARYRRAKRRGKKPTAIGTRFEANHRPVASNRLMIGQVAGTLGAIFVRSKQRRYANVQVMSPEREPLSTIHADALCYVRVDIGALAVESLVEEPTPLPEKLLPHEDIVLDVLLSSNDFCVGRDLEDCQRDQRAVEHRLTLPAGGGPAVSDAGHQFVEFGLRAPNEGQWARARLSYLYRNTVLQSQRLDAEIGTSLRVVTDFTLSTRLGEEVQMISKRPRLTVIANHSPGDRHELTVRTGDASGAPVGDPVSFSIDGERIGRAVAELRGALERRAPRTRRQSRSDLIETLRLIAPLGWRLWTTLKPELQRAVRDAGDTPDMVLQIALSEDSTFTLPWSFIYDIYIEEDASLRDLSICPLVMEWDERSPMVGLDERSCPHAGPRGHEEGTLCPFGFWGYRYSVEVLTSTDEPVTSIRCNSGARAVVGVTRAGIRRRQMKQHTDVLAETFRNGAGLELCEAATKKELRSLIEDDIPILYFLCHGNRRQDLTVLSVGSGDRVPPGDLMGWMQRAAYNGRDPMWRDPQPLVFINACGSTEITPNDLVDYLGAFVRSGNAAGLIGTEVKVERLQAMDLAQEFFGELFKPGTCVEDALRRVRTGFLKDGNLFGLVYTPYCFADLAIIRDHGQSE
jgi:hypothetical protein